MGRDDKRVDIAERETVFQGYFRLDRYKLTHSLHDGGNSPILTREVLERGQVAAVVPFDPIRREIILIEQFRPGALAAGWEPWQLEIVAGIIEPGETAEEMARRETQEESGCKATALFHLGRYLSSPGCTSESIEVFCARIDASKAGGIHGLAEEGEDILVKAYPLDQAFQLLEDGEILNAMTLIGLQWFREKLSVIERSWPP